MADMETFETWATQTAKLEFALSDTQDALSSTEGFELWGCEASGLEDRDDDFSEDPEDTFDGPSWNATTDKDSVDGDEQDDAFEWGWNTSAAAGPLTVDRALFNDQSAIPYENCEVWTSQLIW